MKVTALSRVILSIGIVLLAGAVTISVFVGLNWTKTGSAETTLSALAANVQMQQEALENLTETVGMQQAKIVMLQAEMGTADLTGASEITLVESGECQISHAYPTSLGTIAYEYYSYQVFNLTRYYVEFTGSATGFGAVGATTSASCPGGVRTQRSFFFISECTKEPGNFFVSSLINSHTPPQNTYQAFLPDQLSKITFSGANFVITGTNDQFAPCSPNTYYFDRNWGLPGIFNAFSFGLDAYIWTTDTPPYTLGFDHFRVPIPAALTISK